MTDEARTDQITTVILSQTFTTPKTYQTSHQIYLYLPGYQSEKERGTNMIHSIIHRVWDTQNAGSREISFLRVSVGAMRVLSLSAREPEKTALASELRVWHGGYLIGISLFRPKSVGTSRGGPIRGVWARRNLTPHACMVAT